MYKVITHTIKEEHYTHPFTAEYALSTTSGNVCPIGMTVKPTVSAMTAKDMFRLNVRTLMERYVNTLRGAIVSIFNSGEDLPVLEEEIKKTIEDLKASIKILYSTSEEIPQLASLGEYLIKYTTNLLDIAKAQKNNKPTVDLDTQLEQTINDFSTFLSMSNMPGWEKRAVYSYLIQFSDATKGQILARKSKNWVEDQQQFKNAFNIFVSGIPNMLVSFSQYLADGIIMQFPWLLPLNGN